MAGTAAGWADWWSAFGSIYATIRHVSSVPFSFARGPLPSERPHVRHASGAPVRTVSVPLPPLRARARGTCTVACRPLPDPTAARSQTMTDRDSQTMADRDSPSPGTLRGDAGSTARAPENRRP